MHFVSADGRNISLSPYLPGSLFFLLILELSLDQDRDHLSFYEYSTLFRTEFSSYTKKNHRNINWLFKKLTHTAYAV